MKIPLKTKRSSKKKNVVGLLEITVMVRYVTPPDDQWNKVREIQGALLAMKLAEGAEVIGINNKNTYGDNNWVADRVVFEPQPDPFEYDLPN